ncbi:hypothetical protein Tco_0104459 [Tanacetum coccineum]
MTYNSATSYLVHLIVTIVLKLGLPYDFDARAIFDIERICDFSHIIDIEADDDEEEEEHPAPADSAVVALPAADHAPSAEETEPFEIDESVATPPPHPSYRVTARISIPAPVPIPAWDKHRLPVPPRKRLGITLGPTYEVGESSSTAAARPAGGLRADYGFVATMDREIRRDLERDVGYGITDSWDDIVDAMQGTPIVTDVVDLSQRMIEFETRVRRDTYEVYMRSQDVEVSHKTIRGTEVLIKRLQTQMAEFERQQGPAKGPAQPKLPEEAGSSS